MKLKTLYYAHNGRWAELPAWGQFLLHLGHSLAVHRSYKYRTIIGLTLPTRAYGASLIATGIVAGQSQMRTEGTDNVAYFRQLSTLAPGTSLFYRRTQRNLVKVCFIGYEELHGEPKIRLNDGNHYYVLSPQLSEKVEVAPRKFHVLHKKSRGQLIEASSPFFSCFFENESDAEYAFHSCLDCIIIGSVGRIKEEVNTVTFGMRSPDGKLIKGSLQDIVRVRRFSHVGQAYRSDVYSIHGQESGGSIEQMTSIVVFDGASSFLACRNHWRLSHWIVLLDYTDVKFDEALDAFNEEYIKHHIRNGGIDGPLDVPDAATISAFQEPWI